MSPSERREARDYGSLARAFAAVLFSVMFTILVLWLIFSKWEATPYDADGVRCYSKAQHGFCIKTANP